MMVNYCASFLDKNDKVGGNTASRLVVHEVMRLGLPDATVFRSMEGYGSRNKLRSADVLVLSDNLLVVIEIIAESERVDTFVSHISSRLADGMVSLERLRFQRLSS